MRPAAAAVDGAQSGSRDGRPSAVGRPCTTDSASKETTRRDEDQALDLPWLEQRSKSASVVEKAAPPFVRVSAIDSSAKPFLLHSFNIRTQ
jgi:hypothetical protein